MKTVTLLSRGYDGFRSVGSTRLSTEVDTAHSQLGAGNYLDF